MNKPTFSQTSITGKLPEGKCKAKIMADALSDWGHFYMGHKTPKNFHVGMQAIADTFEFQNDGDSFMAEANKLTKSDYK